MTADNRICLMLTQARFVGGDGTIEECYGSWCPQWVRLGDTHQGHCYCHPECEDFDDPMGWKDDEDEDMDDEEIEHIEDDDPEADACADPEYDDAARAREDGDV
jgi:hypothetical protein